ncbi:NUDIX hydrolase [Govanella unica]|uniref:NUDIX hydrolase n=1 Tax=Govanella unica TaxID=2975056 RepID=A0A9X3TYH8_9PROT|nr:NUDIX hydrolase [Govania unica]MDA5194022.1 NUDIX hydrolase [Govania unica]
MKRDYPDRPFVGVGAFVWKDDKVLLIRRGKAPRKGEWSIPGGAQHAGETVEDAACREVFEETGVRIRLGRLLDVLNLIDRDEAGAVRHHYTLIDYMAEAIEGDARPGDDVTEVAWVHPDELEPYKLWAETERLIMLSRQYREGGL